MSRGYPYIATPSVAEQTVSSRRVNLFGVYVPLGNAQPVTLTVKDPDATGGTGMQLMVLGTGQSLHVGEPGITLGSLTITKGASGDQVVVNYQPLP